MGWNGTELELITENGTRQDETVWDGRGEDGTVQDDTVKVRPRQDRARWKTEQTGLYGLGFYEKREHGKKREGTSREATELDETGKYGLSRK